LRGLQQASHLAAPLTPPLLRPTPPPQGETNVILIHGEKDEHLPWSNRVVLDYVSFSELIGPKLALGPAVVHFFCAPPSSAQLARRPGLAGPRPEPIPALATPPPQNTVSKQGAAGFWRSKFGMWSEQQKQLNGGEYECNFYTKPSGGSNEVVLCGIRNAGHTTGGFCQGGCGAPGAARRPAAGDPGAGGQGAGAPLLLAAACLMRRPRLTALPRCRRPFPPDIPYVGAPFDLAWSFLSQMW
jgi:hypothetical protein